MNSPEKIFAKSPMVSKPLSDEMLPREIVIKRQSNGEGYGRLWIERRYGAHIRSSAQFEGAEGDDMLVAICKLINARAK